MDFHQDRSGSVFPLVAVSDGTFSPSTVCNNQLYNYTYNNTPTETRAGEPATWPGSPRVEVAHGVVAAALPARAARVRAARRPVLAVAAPVLRTRVTSHVASVTRHVASVTRHVYRTPAG